MLLTVHGIKSCSPYMICSYTRGAPPYGPYHASEFAEEARPRTRLGKLQFYRPVS